MIDTVVIPAAGLGARLIPATKEIPKFMLPIFQNEKDGTLLLKPLAEIMFENLYDFGIRNYCVIVGRGKETIENHLTPHYEFIDHLKKHNNFHYAKILQNFYKKLEKSSIIWIRQPTQLGIGHTALLAKDIVGDKPFFFHLGDLYVPKNNHLKKMVQIYEKHKPSAVIGLKKVNNPKQYGIAYGKEIEKNVFKLTKVVEKPKNSNSKLGLSGINIFGQEIFDVIKKIKKNKKGEIELTDCVQALINLKYTIIGHQINTKEICIDMGTPQNYFNALKHSFKV